MTRNTISCDSISELRAASFYNDYEFIQLTGYYLPEDGGACIFIWDNISIKEDDGFLFIKPTSISGNGRWMRLFESNILNVLTAGVKRSNSQLDALENSMIIDKILAYAKIKKNSIIYFPAGIYFIADSIRIPSFTSILGDGLSSCLKAGISIYERPIAKSAIIVNENFDPENQFDSDNDINVSSICIDANNLSWTNPYSRLRGLFFNKVQRVNIKELTVLNTQYNASGISIRNYVPFQFSHPVIPPYSFITKDCIIDNCKVEREIFTSVSGLDYEANIYIDSTMTGEGTNEDNRPPTTLNIKVINCHSIGGIHGVVFANVKDSSIFGCLIKNSVRGVFLGPTSENLIVSENIILDSLTTAIHLAYRVKYTTIISNIIRYVITNTGVFEGNGIKAYTGCSDISIINNNIYGCYREGIAIFSGGITRNITIIGNIVNDNGTSGILISPGKIGTIGSGDINIYNIVISNNISRGNDVGIQLVRIANGPIGTYNTKIVLNGNLVTNNTSKGIEINNSTSVLFEANNVRYNNVDYFKGTDITLLSNFGIAEFIGDGSSVIFAIQHFLDNTPTNISITSSTAFSAAPHFITKNDSFIYINFITPPSIGSSLSFEWAAERV